MKRSDISLAPPVSLAFESHRVEVTEVVFRPDGVSLRYTITPSLRYDGHVYPALEATDDLGNEYDSGGGAFGTTPDGRATTGTLTVQPHLQDAAASVTFALSLLSLDRDEQQTFTITL